MEAEVSGPQEHEAERGGISGSPLKRIDIPLVDAEFLQSRMQVARRDTQPPGYFEAEDIGP